jgi:hypothetical protein
LLVGAAGRCGKKARIAGQIADGRIDLGERHFHENRS